MKERYLSTFLFQPKIISFESRNGGKEKTEYKMCTSILNGSQDVCRNTAKKVLIQKYVNPYCKKCFKYFVATHYYPMQEPNAGCLYLPFRKATQNINKILPSFPSFTSGVHLVHILSMSKNKLIYGIIWLESVRVDLLLLMYCVVICCLTSWYISGCEHQSPFFLCKYWI